MDNNLALSLLSEMATFARVVEARSFSEAARQLGMTKAAVSRHVSRLEAALGARLLMRTTRRLALTEAGQAVYASCSELVAAARSATAAAGQYAESPGGVLRVSAPLAFGEIVLAPKLPAFLARYPDIDMQLTLTDRLLDLVEDGIDVAVRIALDLAPGLAARPLQEIPYLICASPEYLAKRGVPEQPEDLATHDCLYLGHGPFGACWQFKQGELHRSVMVRGRLTVSHSKAMLEAVLGGVGIGLMPAFTAATELQTGRVCQLLPMWRVMEPYKSTAWAVYQPTRYLPLKTRVLIDYLVEVLGAAG